MILLMGACESDETIERIKGDFPLCQNIEPERKIVAQFKEADGFIIAPGGECPAFTISGGPDHQYKKVNLLAPCNLPESFKENNIEVTFSGYLYETFDTEDICAQIFELTSIRRRN